MNTYPGVTNLIDIMIKSARRKVESRPSGANPAAILDEQLSAFRHVAHAPDIELPARDAALVEHEIGSRSHFESDDIGHAQQRGSPRRSRAYDFARRHAELAPVLQLPPDRIRLEVRRRPAIRADHSEFSIKPSAVQRVARVMTSGPPWQEFPG